MHRPSRTIADDALAAVAAFAFSAFVRAVADGEAVALVADVAARLGAMPHATMPTISTAEPAISTRIPIAHPLHSACFPGFRMASRACR